MQQKLDLVLGSTILAILFAVMTSGITALFNAKTLRVLGTLARHPRHPPQPVIVPLGLNAALGQTSRFRYCTQGVRLPPDNGHPSAAFKAP
jgi:hypothetical protein